MAKAKKSAAKKAPAKKPAAKKAPAKKVEATPVVDTPEQVAPSKPRAIEPGDVVQCTGIAYVGNAPFDAKGDVGIVQEVTPERVYVDIGGRNGDCWVPPGMVKLAAVQS